MKWIERIKAVGSSIQQTGVALKNAAIDAAMKNDQLRPHLESAQAKWNTTQTAIEAKLDALEALLWEAIHQGQEKVKKSHRQAQRAKSAQKYFELFELKPNATIDEVKAAWRDKMRQCHPDRFAMDPEAEARAHKQAQTYNLAYQELTALLTGQESRSH